jgi:hypothetical protein
VAEYKHIFGGAARIAGEQLECLVPLRTEAMVWWQPRLYAIRLSQIHEKSSSSMMLDRTRVWELTRVFHSYVLYDAAVEAGKCPPMRRAHSGEPGG